MSITSSQTEIPRESNDSGINWDTLPAESLLRGLPTHLKHNYERAMAFYGVAHGAKWPDSAVEWDLDAFRLSLFPPQLIDLPFLTATTDCRLINRFPTLIPSEITKETKDLFGKWVYVAYVNNGIISISPELKYTLIQQLANLDHVVFPSLSAQLLISGSLSVPLTDLVRALCLCQCDHVRYTQFGQKIKLFDLPDFPEQAHPYSGFNSFDIGRNVDSDRICLFKQKSGIKKALVRPMFLRQGAGYGSCEWIIGDIRMKLYPRAVHSCKADNDLVPLVPHQKMEAAKNRLKRAEKFILKREEDLASYTYKTGYRIEARIMIESLP